jgi:hypothetical protein
MPASAPSTVVSKVAEKTATTATAVVDLNTCLRLNIPISWPRTVYTLNTGVEIGLLQLHRFDDQPRIGPGKMNGRRPKVIVRILLNRGTSQVTAFKAKLWRSFLAQPVSPVRHTASEPVRYI